MICPIRRGDKRGQRAVPLSVGSAQREAVAGRGWVGADGPAGWVEGAVEEHGLDPDVVVEPFQVPQVRSGGLRNARGS